MADKKTQSKQSQTSQSLSEFLREVSNWHWDKFVKAEHDETYSTRQAIIFSLIRACAMEKLDAIKISLDRLDGKLKTPIKYEYPKIFFIYPKATMLEDGTKPTPIAYTNLLPMSGKNDSPDDSTNKPEIEILDGEVLDQEVPEFHEDNQADLATMSLRETLTKMTDYPRNLPASILDLAQQVEEHYRGQPTKLPDEIPRVKSVLAAHLLHMAQERKLNALYEVFDQIDGKLVETIEIVGDDILIPIYTLTAPVGAYLNEAGVLQLEAKQVQQQWTEKFKLEKE